MAEQSRICTQCKGNLIEKNGMLVCDHCRRRYELQSDALKAEIQEVAKRRQLREFTQAEELCRELKKKMPYNSEVYWQSVLAQLAIVYVLEDGKAKPTFFGYSYSEKEEIKNNPDYIKCLENCKSDQEREEYEEKAEELGRLLKEFFSLVDKESSYDIFISFKNSEEAVTADGADTLVHTLDSRKAEEIYKHLTKKGYKVFFSPVSIGKDASIYGEKYEPRILKALQTAQAMILLGTKSSYLSSKWVENEWRRYLYFMQKNLKKGSSLILGYMNAMPSLPTALKDTQWPSVDVFSAAYLTQLEQLLTFVRKKGSLDTVKIESKTVTRKKTGKHEDFVGSSLSIVTDDELALDLDKRLKLIESDLGSSRREKTVKQFARLKSQLEAEGRTDGKVMLLDLAISCGLNSTDDFLVPSNVALVQDMSVFGRVIEVGGSKEWLYSVLDMLYGLASSDIASNKKAAALEIAIAYDYPGRRQKLSEILESARRNIDSATFNLAISKGGLSFDEEEQAILDMAGAALGGGKFSLAKSYAQKIIEQYDEGSATARFTVFLADRGCISKRAYFAPDRVGSYDDNEFDSLKEILSYVPADSRARALDSWTDCVLCDFKDRKLNLRHGKKYLHPDDFTRPGRMPYGLSDIKENAKKRRAAEKNVAFIDGFISFYDRLLSFYTPSEQPVKVAETARLAASSGAGYMALHYYNYALSGENNRAKVYWDMMLCSLGCKNENELYKLDVDIDTDEYFKKALKAADGEEFSHIQQVRQKQLDCAEANRRKNAEIRALDSKNKAIGAITRTVTWLSLIAAIALFASTLLAITGVKPFFALWGQASFALVGNLSLLYLMFALSIVLLAVTAIFFGRSFSLFSGAGDMAGCAIMLALCAIAFISAVSLAFRENKNEYTTCGNNYIIMYGYDEKSPSEDGEEVAGIPTALYIKEVHNIIGANVTLPAVHNSGLPVYLKSGEDFLKKAGSLKITLAGGYSMLEEKAFGESASKITALSIPDSVTTIERGALAGCQNLKELSLPFIGRTESSSAQSALGHIFGKEAYDGSVEVTQKYGSMLISGVYYFPTSLKKVTVSGGEVCMGAFSGCDFLKEVVIGERVTSLSELAFDSDFGGEVTMLKSGA